MSRCGVSEVTKPSTAEVCRGDQSKENLGYSLELQGFLKILSFLQNPTIEKASTVIPWIEKREMRSSEQEMGVLAA